MKIEQTTNQIAYKSYLATDHWKNKRFAVLEQRGCKCEKCGEWGNEIHHLTYENLWNEPLTDLQVLCGDCHDATHRALKSVTAKDRYNKKKKTITRRAMVKALSPKQKEKLVLDFSLPTESDLIFTLLYSNKPNDFALIQSAATYLGFDSFAPKKGKMKRLINLT